MSTTHACRRKGETTTIKTLTWIYLVSYYGYDNNTFTYGKGKISQLDHGVSKIVNMQNVRDVHKNMEALRMRTWNVKSIYKAEKIHIVIHDIQRLKSK